MSFNNKQTKQPIDKVNMALDDIIKRNKRSGNNNNQKNGGGGGKKPFGMLNKSRAIQKNRRPNNNNNRPQQQNRGGPGGPRRGPRPQQIQQQQQRRPRPQGGRLANFNLNKRINNNPNNNNNRGRRPMPQKPRFNAQFKNRLSIGPGGGANRSRPQGSVRPRPRPQIAAIKSRLSGGGVRRGGVARKPLQQPIRKANVGNKIAMQTARKNVMKAKKMLAQKQRILKQTTQRVVNKNGLGAKPVNKMVQVNVRNNAGKPRGKPQVAVKRFNPIMKRNAGPASSGGRTVLY